MNCEEIRDSLSLYLYGELSFDEEDRLEGHLGMCEACAEALAHERLLHDAMDVSEVPVSASFLHQCRRQLHDATVAASPKPGLLRRWADLVGFQIHLPTAAQPVGALALIAMGFFGARLIPQNAGGTVNSASLTEPIASRVRYVEPESSGKIHIVVEETREKNLTGVITDGDIRRLLLTAATDPVNPGLRVESMDLLKTDLLKTGPESRDIRNALLSSLQHDPNAGVRLKALEGLKESAGDPEVRQVLSRVLLTDKNPGVRSQVVDLLIRQKREMDMVGVLQELLHKEDNGYVRMRCEKALHEMKASEGTF